MASPSAAVHETAAEAARRAMPGCDASRALARWPLYLYALSIPIEVPTRSIPLEIPTLVGLVFLAAAALQPRICFRKPPQAFWFFGAFLVVGVILTLALSAEFYRPAARQLIQIGLLVFTLWPAANMFSSRHVAERALFGLILGCLAIAVMQIGGIATSQVEVMSGAERLTVLGQNPNSLARNLSTGALTAVGIGFLADRRPVWVRLLTLPVFGILALAMLQTGARMGMLALAAGILAFCLSAGSAQSRLRALLAVTAAAVIFGLLVARSDIASTRFERTFEDNSFARREIIFPAAWQMFMEQPAFGWGINRNMWVLGDRLGEPDYPYRDTHNLFLEVATSTGFAGLAPFFFGVLLCIRAALVARHGSQGILPLSLLAALLLANMSANLIGQRLFWFAFAFILGSAKLAATERRERHPQGEGIWIARCES